MCSKMPRMAVGLTLMLGTGNSFPGRAVASHSPPYGAEVQNGWSCTCIYACVSAWPEKGELCVDVPLFLVIGNSGDGLHLQISEHTVS